MQEKDTQQLCRMSFLKVHRLFSAPKFDKEPFLWLNSKYNKNSMATTLSKLSAVSWSFYYLIITGTADTAFTDTGGIVIGSD